MKRTGFLGLLDVLPLVGAAFKDDSPGRLEMPTTSTKYNPPPAKIDIENQMAYTSVMLGTYTTCGYHPTMVYRPGEIIPMTVAELKSRFPK